MNLNCNYNQMNRNQNDIKSELVQQLLEMVNDKYNRGMTQQEFYEFFNYSQVLVLRCIPTIYSNYVDYSLIIMTTYNAPPYKKFEKISMHLIDLINQSNQNQLY